MCIRDSGEGDQLLKRVAAQLSTCLRPLDTAARLGGDEFAVLIEDVASRDDIAHLAGRILESLRQAVPAGTRSSASAGSIGIAFDEPGITSEQLLRNADIAMYKAKESGKDRFEVYRLSLIHIFATGQAVRPVGRPRGQHRGAGIVGEGAQHGVAVADPFDGLGLTRPEDP